MEILTATKILSPETYREEWLAERRKGVTATDISAISGLNPYKTVYDVFLEKLDLVEPVPDNPAMKRGRRMEPVLAEDYGDMTGALLVEAGLTINPHKPLMRGTPDRIVVDDDRVPLKVLEIKTAGIRQASRWGEPGTDEIPDEYLCQVQWYMGITGLPEADVIVSIAGEMPLIYTVERNDQMIDALYERAFKFWTENVVPKVPPVVDSSESASEMLARLYGRADLDAIESDATVDSYVKQLETQKAFLKVAEDNVRFYENKIKEIIGDHEGIKGDWGVITWKKTKDGESVDYKGLVASLTLPPEAIAKFTNRKPGYRRFLLKPAKKEA